MRQRKMSFRQILMVSYAVVVLLTLGIYGWRSFAISEKAISGIAQDNMQKLIVTKNELLDYSFTGIREASLRLLVDEELYEIFNDTAWEDTVALREAEEDIRSILQKYFYSYSQVVSAYLVMGNNAFGYGDREVMYGQNFYESELCRKAAGMEGGVLFSAVPGNYFVMMRMANLTYIEKSGRLLGLDGDIYRPVLVIGFSDQMYRDEIQPLISAEGAQFMVLDENGRIISGSDPARTGEICEEEWIGQLAQGRDYVRIGRKDYLVCQASSAVTGWKTVVMIPRDMLVRDVVAEIRNNLIFFLVFSVLLGSVIAALLMRRIMDSVYQMIQAVERMSGGDFDEKVGNTNFPEFDYLVNSFNDMGCKLKQLIEDNYMIRIRQQESELAILNTQLNPHFLQNTLNVIQLSNLNGDQEATGRMIVALSRMLHYTMDNREEMKMLREDMEWLRQYIYIMECRYGNEFQIICEMEEGILDYPVPKLFLQPILENSILHAFKDRESGGAVCITGRRDGERMVFVVEDNGAGMEESELSRFYDTSSASIGIKNVYSRLKLIYKRDDLFEMESSPGKGTRTTITIPLG